MGIIGKFMSENNELAKPYKMLYEVELETFQKGNVTFFSCFYFMSVELPALKIFVQ